LISYFLDKFAKGVGTKRFSRDAMDALVTYHWPGNVRELINVVKRSLLMSASREEILMDDLGEGILNAVSHIKKTMSCPVNGPVANLARMEERHIQRVLSSVKGNKSKAARILGISRTALYEKLGTAEVRT
jgi:transcriptional regulator with PAS, ATPase and Fis domain